MSTLAYTVSDSTTMFRRNVRRLRRYPSLTLLLIGMPIVFLLLFVYVFGGQLGHGLGNQYLAGHSGRAGYLNYVTPGILLMTVAAAVQGTAIVVAMDMTGGIIDRFRTMAIARSAVLTGHVLASLIQALLSVGIVLGVAVALGFRPEAGVLDWLAAIGLVTLFAFALIWLATALGLAAKSVETASNTPMFLTFLPFLGSGFVLVASLPAGLRQFAHYQPFTPTTETLRGLLTGTPIGTNAVVAVAWCVAIALGVLPLGEAPLRDEALGLIQPTTHRTKDTLEVGPQVFDVLAAHSGRSRSSPVRAARDRPAPSTRRRPAASAGRWDRRRPRSRTSCRPTGEAGRTPPRAPPSAPRSPTPGPPRCGRAG